MTVRTFFLGVLLSGALLAQTGPAVGGCPAFPVSNVWNQPVDTLPVHVKSAMYITAIGATAPFRLDDVIPINVVPSTQPEVPVTFEAVAEADDGGYAIPHNPKIEPGSDGHIVVVK